MKMKFGNLDSKAFDNSTELRNQNSTVFDRAHFSKSTAFGSVRLSTCSVLKCTIEGGKRRWYRYSSIPVMCLVQLLGRVARYSYQLFAGSDIGYSTLMGLYA